MYSSCDKRDREIVVCIGCDRDFKNPYYVGIAKDAAEQCAIHGCIEPAAHKTPDAHGVCAECWDTLMGLARKGGQPT